MVRKARKEDDKEIVFINVSCWKESYKGIFPQDYLDNLDVNNLESIRKCENKISEYVVYEKDGQIIGMARYGKNQKDYGDSYGEIYALYVRPDFQRQRVGTELVQYVFNELKKNYKYVLISTLKENKANDFYKKIGGKFMGESDFILDKKIYKENIYKFNLENY